MKITQLGNNQMTIQLSNSTVFFSYDTPVAAFVSGRGFFRCAEGYSKTTTKHINAWFAKNGAALHGTKVPQQEIADLLTKGGAV
jgi:hypothetical protein